MTATEINSLEKTIAERSITVVRNGGILPVAIPEQTDVLLVSDHTAAHSLAAILRNRFKSSEVISLSNALKHDYAREALVIVATASPEAFVDCKTNQELQLRVARHLFATNPERTILLPLREPYIVNDLPQATTVICGFGYRSCTLRAIVAAICRDFSPTGLSPVTIQ